MTFYDAAKLLYLETDASSIGLVARLLQERKGMNCENDEVLDNAMLHPIEFTNKSLSSTEWLYTNIEFKTLQLHGLKRFHHYCFMKAVCVITDHKLFVALLSKHLAMLPQQLQCIMYRCEGANNMYV